MVLTSDCATILSPCEFARVTTHLLPRISVIAVVKPSEVASDILRRSEFVLEIFETGATLNPSSLPSHALSALSDKRIFSREAAPEIPVFARLSTFHQKVLAELSV